VNFSLCPCIAGGCIGYIVFPSHKNNVYI
jgi:hypothetical protein